MSRMVSAPSRRNSRITLRVSSGLTEANHRWPSRLCTLHRRDEEAKILRRHIGQRMRPVFEHALVDALGLAQIGAAIGRDAAIENVVMAALDHVDGVDLHIAEMVHRRRDRLRPGAERLAAYRAAGRAARFAGPRLWSGDGVRSRGASRGNVIGFADVTSPDSGYRPLRTGITPPLLPSPTLPVAISASQEARPGWGAWHL